MLKLQSADWVNDTQTDFNSEHRFYLDPRGAEYPVLSGTPSYVEVSGAYNMPGSYWLSSEVEYLLSPGNSVSGEILFKNVSVDATVVLLRFYGGYTLTLSRASGGGYTLVAVGGSTVTCSGGTIQPIQRVGFTFTYGSNMELYVDGVFVDGDAAPALTTKPVYLEINAGAQYVSHVRIFNGYAATDADHLSSFKDCANEEIFFSFNKADYGRTRCNINTAGFRSVNSFTLGAEDGYKTKTASISLLNNDGQYSDDQYATFAPELGSYNGSSIQRYLTSAVGLEIETWAPTDTGLYPSTSLYPSTTLFPSGCFYTYEPLFRGLIPSGSFNRSTGAGGVSTISVSAEDAIAEISRRVVRRPRSVQDYYLSRATPSSNSVLHFIAELATKKEVYNYLTNSSFENATIGDSWSTTGTLTRISTAALADSYAGNFSGTDKALSQTVMFADLTKGESFTGSIYIYSASAINGTLVLTDNDSGGVNGTTSTAWAHTGKGWEKATCEHAITDSTSDRIVFTCNFTGTVANIPVDCAMLKYGGDIGWIVINSNSGTTYSASGVSAIGSEMSASYDYVGIVADDVTYQHPWVQVEDGDNIWEEIKNVCDAILARHCFIDASNVMRIPSMLSSALPASLGSLPAAAQIASGQQRVTANKLTVQGVQILEWHKPQTLWMAESANIEDDSDSDGKFSRTLADGETFPSIAIDGVVTYEAKYDSGDSGDESYRKYRYRYRLTDGIKYPTTLVELIKYWFRGGKL